MRRRAVILVAVVATLAVAIAAWLQAGRPAEPPVASRGRAAQEAPAPVAPSVEPVPAVRPDGGTAPTIRMRDGTELPALNGVTDTGGLKWSAARSRTPVVGVLRGRSGAESYVHADGSRSATLQVENADTGETFPATMVFRPVDPSRLPIVDRSEAAQPIQPR